MGTCTVSGLRHYYLWAYRQPAPHFRIGERCPLSLQKDQLRWMERQPGSSQNYIYRRSVGVYDYVSCTSSPTPIVVPVTRVQRDPPTRLIDPCRTQCRCTDRSLCERSVAEDCEETKACRPMHFLKIIHFSCYWMHSTCNVLRCIIIVLVSKSTYIVM